VEKEPHLCQDAKPHGNAGQDENDREQFAGERSAEHVAIA